MSEYVDQNRVITIDGPAGAGKSTAARRVAEQLGLKTFPTGLLFRLAALHAITCKIAFEDESRIVAMMRALRDARSLRVVRGNGSVAQVLLNDMEHRDQLRSPKVEFGTPIIARYKGVHEVASELQRDFAGREGCVLEGRDLGTTVFPEAGLKIFLTASSRVRADRRFAELVEQNVSPQPDLRVIQQEIEHRDQMDRSRTFSPLRRAADAIEIDSSDLTPEGVADTIVTLARLKL